MSSITRRPCGNACDEWEMIPCRDCGHTARICCLKVEATTWANKLILKSNDHPTDCDSSNGEKNTCGRFALIASPCLNFSINWTLAGGVSCKRVFVEITGTVQGDSNTISHFFYGGLDWYTSPISWTQSGTTYTVSQCESGDEGIDYTAADTVILKEVRQFVSDSSRLIGYGHGDRLCGTAMICGTPLENATGQTTCYLDGAVTRCYALEWTYSILTDLVTVKWGTVTGGSFTPISTLFTRTYGTGAWVDPSTAHTIWSNATETYNEAVGRVLGCDDSWEPDFCVEYSCFPLCLVKTCDGGTTADAFALFVDVSSLHGCCLDGSYNFTWNAGGSFYYSGKIGDATLSTCGYVEIWYECSGATFQRRVKVTDVNGGTSETTQASPGSCVGTPQNFQDTFNVLSSVLTPLCFNEAPFYSDTVTFDVYTNN